MLTALLHGNVMDPLTGKFRDRALPKMMRRNIRPHHPNLPRTRKPPPHFVCYLSADSTPPVSAKNEELSHIPDSQIAGDFRASLHENQSCQVASHFYEKRISARLAPIKWKRRVAKPAGCPYLERVEFTEIVCIQLQEILDRRLLFRCGWDHFDIGEQRQGMTSIPLDSGFPVPQE
jgi:hypothetical protein